MAQNINSHYQSRVGDGSNAGDASDGIADPLTLGNDDGRLLSSIKGYIVWLEDADIEGSSDRLALGSPDFSRLGDVGAAEGAEDIAGLDAKDGSVLPFILGDVDGFVLNEGLVLGRI